MHTRAEPDERSDKRLDTRLASAQRQQDCRWLERPWHDGGDDGIPVFRCAKKPTPPSQARSGEMLKTRHWRVFALRASPSGPHFHLIGSNPVNLSAANKKQVGFPTCPISLVEMTGFEPATPTLRT